MQQDIYGICHIDPGVNPEYVGYQGAKWVTLNSREDLIEYLLDDYLTSVVIIGELDEEQKVAARERFELAIEQSFGDEALAEALNDLCAGLRCIIWLGPIAALAELHESFACDMRRYYWQEYGDDDEDPQAPVPDEQWDDFLTAIEEFMSAQEYGRL